MKFVLAEMMKSGVEAESCVEGNEGAFALLERSITAALYFFGQFEHDVYKHLRHRFPKLSLGFHGSIIEHIQTPYQDATPNTASKRYRKSN